MFSTTPPRPRVLLKRKPTSVPINVINKIQQVPDFEVTIQEMKSLIKKAEKMLEENSVPFKELIDLVVKEIVVNRDNIQIYMCFDKKFIQER